MCHQAFDHADVGDMPATRRSRRSFTGAPDFARRGQMCPRVLPGNATDVALVRPEAGQWPVVILVMAES
jgi:hypothetical protein